MIKENKWRIIISSLVTLSPMLIGLFLWEKLPENMVIHFDAQITQNAMASKPFAVFALPLIMLFAYWLCLFFTTLDTKQKNQNPKAFRIIFWIIPAVSLLSNGIVYSAALGKELSVEIFLPVVLGLLFVFIGNYMPKTKQNRTLGIRIFYTMANEENWAKTHRFAGKVWVIGGIAILFLAFLPVKAMFAALIAFLIILIVLPTVYSYKVYREHCKKGIKYEIQNKTRFDKTASKISAIIVPIILVLTLGLMITGDIDAVVSDNTLEINASYFDDISVDIDKIESVSYSDVQVPGTRVYGFGSFRLLMGTFKNDEFGNYTRYTYAKTKEAVIIKTGGKVLVVNLETPEKTKELYNTLVERV